MEEKTSYNQSDIIRKFLYMLKSNWLMISIIIAVAIAVGVVISYFQVPVYTATCKTIYKAEADFVTGDVNKYDNITLTNRYQATVIEFCKQGCITDRANYYYNQYIAGNYETVEEYIAEQDANPVDEYLVALEADKNAINNLPQHIVMNGVSIKAPNEDSYIVNVSYTDGDFSACADKLKLVFYSINKEAKVQTTRVGKTFYKYFYNAKVTLTNTTLNPSPYNSVNKKKTVLISIVVGVAAAFAAVYVQNMFSRTLRSRQELEEITGAGFLAYIEDQGV
jgi:capsular polysaccharide biosynthesis protein